MNIFRYRRSGSLVGVVAVAALGITVARGGTEAPRPPQAPAGDVGEISGICSSAPGGGLVGVVQPRTRAALYKPWGKKVLKVSFMDGADAWNTRVKGKVREIVKEWEDYADVKFDFAATNSPDIKITLEQGVGKPYGLYQSHYGPESQGKSPSMWLIFKPKTGDGELKATILHEFGHALGLIHEQKRPDSGIEWIPDKVYEEYAYTQWCKAKIYEQVMKPFELALKAKTPFDETSIMIYPIKAGLAKNIVVGWMSDLSPMDKAFISKPYPFDVPILPLETLAIDDPESAAGEIRRPGQVARYSIAVKKKGRYTIRAAGETPVLIALFGSDRIELPRKVAASEGPGAAIESAVLDPENPGAEEHTDPGTYYLEVRHASPRTGTGKFRVAIKGD